jgi:uncharacterized protein (TIGR02246 family)
MQIRRKLALLALSTLGLGCASAPPAFTDTDRAAIRSAIEEFTADVNRGDFGAAVAAGYTKDGTIMPPNGPAVEGRDAIQKAFEAMGRPVAFSQPIVEINGEGNLAYARVNYDLTLTPPNAKAPANDKGKALIVMRKEADGRWRTIRGMWNSDLPLAR